ncbi:MAG: CHASE2 domain-containing serine/threonine-protein kinase [Leptolyngbyaceae cyanobacterium bins.59]|nr:CHASE2 domain-containing serine/threonine-protein kinase [Leptolyngbyaceae cyanobacterium bins.59]
MGQIRSILSVVLVDFLRRFKLMSLEGQGGRAIHPLLQSVALTSTIVTALVMGGQQVGFLQRWEVAFYDQMVRLRPNSPPDSRLLIVAVTEKDLARYTFPIPDRVLAQALQSLQRHSPRVIGLDLFRNFPKEPGSSELNRQLQPSNLIAIYKLGTTDIPQGISQPPGVPADRTGFNDVVTDFDGVLRRNLLFAFKDEETLPSFAVQLAMKYLAKDGLKPEVITGGTADRIAWGKAIFAPLETTSGGYQQVDAAGYQILLNYRTSQPIAPIVTLQDVLENRVPDALLRDRIVLIGTIAPTVRDLFFTPYSATIKDDPKMPGVLIHAQMLSQILDSVMGTRPLIHFWPDWAEVLWLWGWAISGGLLAWRLHHPLTLGLTMMAGVGGLLGIGFSLFVAAIWVPLAAPGVALVLSVAGTLAYRTYEMQQERRAISLQAQTQERTIALLQTLLSDQTRPMTDITRPNDLTALPPELILAGETENWNTQTDIPTRPMDQARAPFLLAQRYKLLKVLGSGGFGLTYLAEDTQRPGYPTCVVKHLLPARSDTRFLQTARRLFRTEAEILEKLGSHDQIPQLLASFEENDRFYLVQEFIEGTSLADELLENHPWPEARVILLLKDVLEVLSFVHSYHVIHRDIKPSNLIQRKRDGKLVLIDFGAVKQMHPQMASGQTGDTVAIGTRGYAPPEQLAGHPGLNSDLYSLGMIAIQALTGVSPQQLIPNTESGDVQWRHLVTVDEQLATILDRMVRYYFTDRYGSAIAVLQDLAPFVHRNLESGRS